MLEHLLSPWTLGPNELKNRVVMAPMTRSRSLGNVPGETVAVYYGQRTEAGLIVTEGDIEETVAEYVRAARLAIEAGFDGVELHGANGYLIDQFLNTASNHRTDRWGGSIENRTRFAREVARRTADAIGGDRLGIRLSPYGVFSDMVSDDGIEDTFE
jgi:N-ethylmaleimide reductase